MTDEIETVQDKVREIKHTVKAGALEVESLRAHRAEVEKNVKSSRTDAEDDGRLVPLYDWFAN